jgi:hypothetical protein
VVPIYLSLELLQGLLQSVQLKLLLRCGGAAVLQPLLQLFHLYTKYIKRFLKRTRVYKKYFFSRREKLILRIQDHGSTAF